LITTIPLSKRLCQLHHWHTRAFEAKYNTKVSLNKFYVLQWFCTFFETRCTSVLPSTEVYIRYSQCQK